MDRVYDYESGRFKASYRDMVSFDLNIREPITQIYGDSATGKTLLVNYIKNEKRNSNFNNLDRDALKNVFAFDDNLFVKDLSRIERSLVVIDRCDLLLTSDILDFIVSDRKNHYLLFSRTGLPLGLSPNYYGDFVVNEENKISILYKYSEVGW